MAYTNYVKNNELYASGLSVVGQVRKANEDSCGHAKTAHGHLFVVCDGMGGHVGGATASRIAVDSIIAYVQQHNNGDKRALLQDAILFANMQILGEAATHPELKGMGTTACVVLVDGRDAWIAHVGDSRIYLYEAAKKRLFRITKDHSLVQALVDKGELDDREAEHHPQKNIILRALGTKEAVQPEVEMQPVNAARNDMFLICSDGLSGMVDDVEIERMMQSRQDVNELVQDLVARADAPGKGKDNITAQVIQVVNSPVAKSVHPDYNPLWRKKVGGFVTAGGGRQKLPRWAFLTIGIAIGIGLILFLLFVILGLTKLGKAGEKVETKDSVETEVIIDESTPTQTVSLEFNKASITLQQGESCSILDYLNCGGKNAEDLHVTSSDTKVVSYQNGKLKGIGAGNATITANLIADPTNFATVKVIVTKKATEKEPQDKQNAQQPKVSKMTFKNGEKDNPGEITCANPGSLSLLKYLNHPGIEAKDLIWNKSNGCIDLKNGVVTAKSQGETTVTVEWSKDKSNKCSVTVKVGKQSGAQGSQTSKTIGKGTKSQKVKD